MDIGKYRSRDSQITFLVIHGWLAFGGPAMLTKMTEEDWVLVLDAESGGGSPASSPSCARYQSDLRAPKFWAVANPLVVRRTIVSKALSAAAASISGSDAWCRFLMISACRGDGTSP
jgi:hypothetical protein